MTTTYSIIGWEYNGWKMPDFYVEKQPYQLITTDCITDKRWETQDLNEAITRLNYLKSAYNDYGWYILTEIQ